MKVKGFAIYGQLPKEKPVLLDRVTSMEETTKVIREYRQYFSPMLAWVEICVFEKPKPIVSEDKKQAIGNLLAILFSPQKKLSAQLQTMGTTNSK